MYLVDLNGGMPSRDMSPKMTLPLENKTSTDQVNIFLVLFIHLIYSTQIT